MKKPKTSKVSPIQRLPHHLIKNTPQIYVYISNIYIYIFQTHICRWWLFVLLTIKLTPKIVFRFRRFQKTPKVHGGPYIDATGLGPWHLANGPCQRAGWSAGGGTLEEKIVACLEGSSRHDWLIFMFCLVKQALEDEHEISQKNKTIKTVKTDPMRSNHLVRWWARGGHFDLRNARYLGGQSSQGDWLILCFLVKPSYFRPFRLKGLIFWRRIFTFSNPKDPSMS